MESNGQKMAEQLTDFVNSATSKDREDFVKAIMKEHRTLQQLTFNLMLATMDGFASQKETGNYDERNRDAVLTSDFFLSTPMPMPMRED